MGNGVKYFIYVSDSKLDRIYPAAHSQEEKQFKALLAKLLDEVTVGFTPFGIGVGKTFKRVPVTETRYSKLESVIKYIEKHFDVGSIDAPKEYFKGSLPMSWGLYPHDSPPDSPSTAYFGGSTSTTTLGLAGSPQYLLDYHGSISMQEISPTALYGLLPILGLEQKADDEQIAGAVEYITNELPPPRQNLEFLAKMHIHVPGERKAVLLGTPIYVAEISSISEIDKKE